MGIIRARTFTARNRLYFHLLLFGLNVFLLAEYLRIQEEFSYYQVLWKDWLPTLGYILSFGAVCIGVISIAMSILHTLWSYGWQRQAASHKPLIESLPFILQGIAFVGFITPIVNQLRIMISAAGLGVFASKPLVWVEGIIVLAAVVYVLLHRQIRPRLENIVGTVRIFNLAVLLAAFGLAVYGYSDLIRPGRTPNINFTSATERPPVFVIVLDSLSAEDMSLYGYPLKTTPNIDKLAEEWTVYENAYANVPSTLPGNAAILTGRYPYFNEWYKYGDRVRNGDFISMPQVFKNLDYKTLTVQFAYHPNYYHLHQYFDRILVSEYSPFLNLLIRLTENTRMRPGRVYALITAPYTSESGLPPEGENVIESPKKNQKPVKLSAVTRYFRMAKELIAENKDDPLFLLINDIGPHYPYLASGYMGKFLPINEGLNTAQAQKPYLDAYYSAEEQPTIDNLRLRYDEAILKSDAALADFVSYLKDQGLYDQSMIIITADHGESFAGGRQGHDSERLTEGEIHIPLIIKYPHQSAGQRVTAVAEQIDILPTILDVLGVDSDTAIVDGQSLLSSDQDGLAFTRHLVQNNPGSDRQRVVINSESYRFIDIDHATFLYAQAINQQNAENLIASQPQVACQYLEEVARYQQRLDYFREGGLSTEAPPLSDKDPALDMSGSSCGSIAPIAEIEGSSMNWSNTDAQFGSIQDHNALYFGPEAKRSYASVSLPAGTEYILVHFETPTQTPSITQYIDMKDDSGNRLDFYSVLTRPGFSYSNSWDILLAVPDTAVEAVFTFKDDQAKIENAWIENLKATFFGQE